MATRHVLMTVASLAVGVWATAASAQSNIHLYVLDTHTGAFTQATPAMGFEPYNASFSNSGEKLVHDLYIPYGPPQTLGITDLASGTVTDLGIAGDNAVWSPNGQYIAYNFIFSDPAEEPWQLRVIPAAGGEPVFTRDWAADPSWSNNSRRLAFMDLNAGFIGTVGLDGTETELMAWGCNPAWSPNGKLIVYERFECWWQLPGPLMAIAVNERGEALTAPWEITSGEFYAQHPSFANDGMTLLYVGNVGDPYAGDWGLYTVGVYGGDPLLLFNRAGKGDWDAAFSKNGRYIVFSGPE